MKPRPQLRSRPQSLRSASRARTGQAVESLSLQHGHVWVWSAPRAVSDGALAGPWPGRLEAGSEHKVWEPGFRAGPELSGRVKDQGRFRKVRPGHSLQSRKPCVRTPLLHLSPPTPPLSPPSDTTVAKPAWVHTASHIHSLSLGKTGPLGPYKSHGGVSGSTESSGEYGAFSSGLSTPPPSILSLFPRRSLGWERVQEGHLILSPETSAL